MPSVRAMTAKEQAFVNNYCKLGNATEAAVQAGYSMRTAAVMGTKLMRKPKIREALKKMLAKAEDINASRIALSKRQILQKLSDNLNRDLADFEDERGFCISKLRELPKRVMAFVDGFKVKQFYDREGNITHQTIEVKLSPSAAAQEMALKFRGMFKPEKHELAIAAQVGGFDWQRLYSPPPEEDPIEAEILAVKALPSPTPTPTSNGNGKSEAH